MAERQKIAPELCSWVDDGHTKLNVEVVLPGVKKEDLQLKMHEDSMYLVAPRRDGDIEYVATLAFCCPVKPSGADAHYENGLLKIEIPFKDPMEDAVAVSVH